MNVKREIVFTVVKQIFENSVSMNESDFEEIDFADSENFDSDNLYPVWEEISETFNVSNEIQESTNMKELIDIITEKWDGETLDRVDENLVWVPINEYSMPYWADDNPNWKPWGKTM